MHHVIEFETADRGKRGIALKRAIIAGWTGRSRDAVNHHIEELKAIGVAPPSSVPLFYRIAASLVTCENVIQTVGESASGEAEPMLVDDGGRLYLGLGSDHTDRELEAHSVALSKQVCAKPAATTLWPFDEVADHLDELRIRSFVRDEESADWQPYQEGTLAAIRPLRDLVAAAPDNPGDGRLGDGTAMMCGTFPVLSGGVRAARFFRMEMIDDKLGRRIDHSYETVPLPVVA